MPTASTLPLILLVYWIGRRTNGQILPAVLFTSVFTAASAIDLGSLGISCWLFSMGALLVLKLLRGHRPFRFTSGINKVALRVAIVFVAYAAWTGMVYPFLFRGVPVTRLVHAEPLAWGLANFAQLCYLFAAVVLYFVAVSSTREELRQAVRWYIHGCVTATLIAYYQLANAIAHVPYPDPVLYSNKTHVIYHAYKINGMWRLNATFNEASEMSAFLAVGIALLGWSMIGRPLKFTQCASLALMIVAMLMTLSSTGYLSLGLLFFVGGGLYTAYLLRGGAISHGQVILGTTLLVSFIALFTLSPGAVATVDKVITSTLLEKKNSESYKERTETHVTSLQTLSDTYYMGAGWGSVRASGLFYVLLGNTGVIGLGLFLGFVGSLFLPLFQSTARGAPPGSYDALAQALLAIFIMLAALVVAGSDVADPMLWVLFGVATMGPRPRQELTGAADFALSTGRPQLSAAWRPRGQELPGAIHRATIAGDAVAST